MATPSPPTKRTPITPTAGASSNAIFSRPPKALVLQYLFPPALLECQQPLRAGLGYPVLLQDARRDRRRPLGLRKRLARLLREPVQAKGRQVAPAARVLLLPLGLWALQKVRDDLGAGLVRPVEGDGEVVGVVEGAAFEHVGAGALGPEPLVYLALGYLRVVAHRQPDLAVRVELVELGRGLGVRLAPAPAAPLPLPP